ncbi:hypothetical protein CAPGI0001_0944 [Capnocytophaga gingivalis ATCC 33624]|nr:hypothetical protein CAPGI0001_0944 [Capnocytophaga gingivalis ATCC 33624]
MFLKMKLLFLFSGCKSIKKIYIINLIYIDFFYYRISFNNRDFTIFAPYNLKTF